MTSLSAKKATALFAGAAATAGLPHALLLATHDALGAALQQPP